MLRIALVELPGFISHSNWPFHGGTEFFRPGGPAWVLGTIVLVLAHFPGVLFCRETLPQIHRFSLIIIS